MVPRCLICANTPSAIAEGRGAANRSRHGSTRQTNRLGSTVAIDTLLTRRDYGESPWRNVNHSLSLGYLVYGPACVVKSIPITIAIPIVMWASVADPVDIG